MDIQITDFENTCLVMLLSMVVNVINYFNVNFIIPINLVDQNMDRAHKRNGILTEKFWFNKHFVGKGAY